MTVLREKQYGRYDMRLYQDKVIKSKRDVQSNHKKKSTDHIQNVIPRLKHVDR